jgi:F-box and WD-40 domain protein CDC4
LNEEDNRIKQENMSIFGVTDHHLYNSLLSLSDEQKAKMLRAISQNLDFGNALFIHAFLEKRLLSMPLLNQLPRPALQQVFKHLDHQSLATLACCCREYEKFILSGGDSSLDIWHHVCHRGIDRLPAEVTDWMVKRAANASHLTVYDFTSGYYYAHTLNRNWNLNLGRVSTIEIPGSRTVTDICADWTSQRLFMASDDSIVRVYEYQNGLHLRGVLSGHQGGVWCMQAIGDLLITGSTDRTIAIWNVRSMNKQLELIGHGSTIRSLVIHQQYVISGSRDGIIRVWEWTTGRCVFTLSGHSGSIRCLSVYSNSRSAYLISGSYDETAAVWSLDSGQLVHRLEGHSGRLYALSVYRHFIYTAGMDHRVKKWNIMTGECVCDILTSQTLIGMMSVHNDRLVTGSTDGKVCVFDCVRDELLFTIQIESSNSESINIQNQNNTHPPPAITSVSLNDSFVVVTSDCSAYIFSLLDGNEVHHIPDASGVVWRGTCTEGSCFIAYQKDDSTRLLAADYRPMDLDK